MTKLEPLKKWKYHYFESASYRTEDYAKFEGTLSAGISACATITAGSS